MARTPAQRSDGVPVFTDEEWVAKWLEHGCSPTTFSEQTGISLRNTYNRRNSLERRGFDLPSIQRSAGSNRPRWYYPREINVNVAGKSILAGSDPHFWHQQALPIWEAFCAVAHELKHELSSIVMNGDVIDGARISRHARLPGTTPKVTEEIEAARANLGMLPAEKTIEKYWEMGNHDTRVDTYLCQNAPELEDWAGSLVDRFTDWSFSWSLLVNDHTIIRHRFRGGMHAAYNNALHSGLSCVTGHTHQLEVRSIQDMRGTRYGVETGMLGDPLGPQFQYAEGAPSRACAGFALLTFDEDGTLLPPELCRWQNGAAWFRNRTYAGRMRVRVPAKSSKA